MKIDKNKFLLAMAQQKKRYSDLMPGISRQTIAKAKKGEDMTPLSVGKIAAALGVDVAEIVEMGE